MRSRAELAGSTSGKRRFARPSWLPLCTQSALWFEFCALRAAPIAMKSTRVFQIWKRPWKMTWRNRMAERWRWYASGWQWSSLKETSALWPVSLWLHSGLVWCSALLAGVSCMFQGFIWFYAIKFAQVAKRRTERADGVGCCPRCVISDQNVSSCWWCG